MHSETAPTAEPDGTIPPDLSRTEVDEAFGRLRELKRSFGRKPNQHERAEIMVAACILEGFDTRRRIVGAMRQLGFDHRHVVLTLSNRTGGDPKVHQWKRDEVGRYHLLDPA